MKHITDEELFKLVDGELSAAQQETAQTHINQCTACKALYIEIASFDTHLQQIILERPSEEFTGKLMEKWQVTSATNQPGIYIKSYSRILASIAFGLGLLLILLSSWFSTTKVPLNSKPISIGYDFTAFQNVLQNEILINSLLLLNAILILLIIDKAVFQPYFNKKMRQSTH